ncbi:MAG: carbohydrate ABC transporter permease, partial [Butyrivibrio sp.]|nr:carbohydrate ABC transporter permease [Butyrivibrio sp.]
EQSDFATAIVHSVVLTTLSEILIIIVVPLSAFGIERRGSKVTRIIYTYFLAGMMIPFHLYMFPLFKELKIFRLFGHMAGPIVIYVSGAIAFGTLLYCSFLKGIPLEIEEAAMIDGCSPFRTFWNITFPLLGPCTASMVILNGLGIWNDYLMPYLVLPSGKAKTITVEIASFVGQYTARWDIVFAGTVISMVPALAIFMLFQKYFVNGITAGAAKG